MFLKSYISQRNKLTGLLLAFIISLGSISSGLAEEKLTLNFTDTDINAVINAVAKLTGKNFIIDPRVKGKVTVITHEAMSKDEVYLVFLSLLKVHGFAAVPGKNITKIIPEANAKQDSIKTVDRARFSSGDELITQVIPIKYVNASKLVPILRPLIPQRGHLAAYPQSNILIISDSSSNVARLMQIISRIDQSVNENIEVMTLEHANASDVVQTIKQLKKAKTKDDSYTLVPDDRTNSILISGDKHARVRLRALISHLDIPLQMGGDTHVIYLKYAKATELVKVLTGVSKTLSKGKGGKGAKAAATPASTINIQADESNNALVINAPQGILRSLRNVVRQLDLRRAQVLVEAIIAEVSYDKTSELGIQWGADGSEGGSRTGPVGVINLGTEPTIANLLEEPPELGEGLSLGIGRLKNGALNVGMLIRALAGDAATNILSTPSIVTMDNQEASIVVGQNVPFITGSYSNTGSTGGSSTSANPFQTIERQDVGLTLKIKPQINEGGAIKLEIEQEVSSIASSAEGSADLITNKRAINTNVLVKDDQVLVLGGLIEEQLTESERKVPLLGDIPIIGWLFKHKRVKKVKTNLMVFIHPTILKDQAITSRETAKKYNFIRNKQLEAKEKGLDLFSNDEVPVISEFEPVPALPPRYQPKNMDAQHDAPPEAL